MHLPLGGKQQSPAPPSLSLSDTESQVSGAEAQRRLSATSQWSTAATSGTLFWSTASWRFHVKGWRCRGTNAVLWNISDELWRLRYFVFVKALLRQSEPVCDLVTVSSSDFLTRQMLSRAGRTVVVKTCGDKWNGNRWEKSRRNLHQLSPVSSCVSAA